MYFSRITPNPNGPVAAGLVEQLCNNAYRVHQLLWGMFDDDPDVERDFVFRQELSDGWPSYYLVSARKPRDKAGWKTEVKEYAPRLRNGDVLAFKLRCNPTVTRLVGGKKKRCDVVIDEKKRIHYQQMPKCERPSMQHLVQRAGARWLLARNGKYGFTITEGFFRVEGYRQHVAYRRKKRITYSTIDFDGLLTVSDKEKFLKALFSGIGPAKAFGCGMLLVRKV